MLEILKFADARLREPSTWAGLAALVGVLHLSVDPGLWQAVTLWGTVGAAGFAILLNESGTRPKLQIAEDVLAGLAVALQAAAPPPPTPAAADAPAAPAKPAVAATLALLLAGALTLSACASGPGTGAGPDPKQALYSVESAYALVANDETAAIRTGVVPAATAVAMRDTDNTLYAALVAWRASVEAGNPAAAGIVSAVQAGLQGLVSQLNAAKALSPPALAAADAALSLTAALIAGD